MEKALKWNGHIFELQMERNSRQLTPGRWKHFRKKKHKYERHFSLRNYTVVFPDLGDNFLALLHNFQIERNNVLLRFAEINKKKNQV